MAALKVLLESRKQLSSYGRFTASSILEVVIAMVMIVLVLGLSMAIYTNVMRLSLPARTVRAQLVLQQAMDNLEQTGQDQTLTTPEGWQISQQVKPYDSSAEKPDSLSTAELVLTDESHHELASLKKVIALKTPAHE